MVRHLTRSPHKVLYLPNTLVTGDGFSQAINKFGRYFPKTLVASDGYSQAINNFDRYFPKTLVAGDGFSQKNTKFDGKNYKAMLNLSPHV